MRAEGLRSKVLHKHRYLANRPNSAPPADNLLARNFLASAPDQKWTGNITYLWTDEGWLYLAVVLDMFSRRVVGWSMSEWADAQLACGALETAIQQRKAGLGLLHHSDQGCQYSSEAFASVLDRYGILCSMSRRGNCWDNAVTESFFGKLKREWVRGKRYRTRNEARQDIFLYRAGLMLRALRRMSRMGMKGGGNDPVPDSHHLIISCRMILLVQESAFFLSHIIMKIS